MKYLAILLIAIAALISVKAKIPDYIKVCKRNDSRLGECIKNSVNGMKNKLVEGIPQLEVPPLGKLKFPKLDLDLGPGLKAEIRDVVLEGLENFFINDVVANFSADIWSFNVSFPEITARGTYDLDAMIGSIPLKGIGPLYFSPRSVIGQGSLYGRTVVRGGRTFYYFVKMDLKLIIGDFLVKLENLFDGEPTIGEATNNLLNEQKSEVLVSLVPGLEKLVIERILLIANNICKHFTRDELFPES